MTSDEKTTNQDAASEESEDTSAAGEKTGHAAEVSPSVAVEEKTAGLTSQGDDFLADADAPQVGLVAEFVDFLKYNKKWSVSYTHLPSPRDRTRSRMPSSA